MSEKLEQDATQEFLNSLQEVAPGEQFRFACHPGVPCFNACCADLNLVLTPYDVLRLRRALDMSSEDFLQVHCRVSAYPDSGFPMVHLLMGTDPNQRCSFVTVVGCSVYPDRPSACRIYPLGRATRFSAEQGSLVEQYFLVEEDHCHGFSEDGQWDIAAWTADQGLEPYTASNDRLALLMAGVKATNTTLSSRHGTMCLLALYQPDRFQQFIKDMKLFERVELPEKEQEAVLQDEERCLEFALDWLELVLFGQNDRLKPKA